MPQQPRWGRLVGSGAALAVVVALAGATGCTTSGDASSAGQRRTVPVTFTGGFEVHADDYGRPVPLYASMLGVTPEVFRQAFSGVRPDPGHEPSAAQATANKVALLSVLARHGVTNDELDRVANHYRFDSTRGQTWPHRPARAEATVVDGKVVAIRLLDPGVGYSYPPRVSIAGIQEGTVTATLAFTTSFETNGQVAALRTDV